MRKNILLFIKIICFGFLLILLQHTETFAVESKNVLVLHSYNQGFIWSSDINSAIEDVLCKNNLYNINMYPEYMDAKNKTIDSLYSNRFYESLMLKYKDTKFDLVIASDNPALNFINNYNNSLFKDIPIVLCGINSSETDISPYDNKIYMLEKTNIEDMLNNIHSLQPEIKNIVAFGSNSTNGKNDFDSLKDISYKYKGIFNFSFNENADLDKLKSTVNENKKDSAILLLTDPFLQNNNYRYLGLIKDNFFKENKTPIYSFWDFDLDFGIIGGNLISGYSQGEAAAKIGLDILNGKPLSSISKVNESPNRCIYDYNKLKQLNISLKSLPKESIIINKPFSFYEKYKIMVWFVSVVFMLLISMIAFLTILIRQKKKNEIALNCSYEELSAVYEELTATEEELRVQYEDLLNSREIIKDSEEKYRLAVEGANDAIWQWDILNNDFFISSKWTEITGYETDIKFQDIYYKLIVPEQREVAINELDLSLKNQQHFYKSEFKIISKDNDAILWLLSRGKVLRDTYGKPIKMAGSITDITERKIHEKYITEMAYYDSLTKLPNRMLFSIRLENCIKDNKENSKLGAVIFLDLDEFKKVNDTLGHYKGDLLLKVTAERIKNSVPLDSLVARFGGDEFLVLISPIENYEYLEIICNKILDSIKEPIPMDDSLIYITCSMGIIFFPQDGTTVDNILKNADSAMYKAKKMGKNQYCFFDNSILADLINKTNIENNLRFALENHELYLNYQPLVDIVSRRTIGLESLIRWKNKEFGNISPAEFIPIAENSGLIISIGQWVLEKSCAKIRELLDKGFNLNYISVNVSMIQFIRNDFVDTVIKTLDKYDIPAPMLSLEITESVLVDNTEENLNKIKTLRKLGIKISLDDFGTGYSSLNYLRMFSIDTLKIDKSFIQDIEKNLEEKVICNFLIKLSQELNFKVIAEGIENELQLNILESMNCHIAQGFYLSRPLGDEALEDFLIKESQCYK